MSASEKRWKIAQAEEKKEWIKLYRDIERFKEADKSWRRGALVVENEVGKYYSLEKDANILQIGCALRDVIHYLSIGKKYAIDPLAIFFKTNFDIFGNSDIPYVAGVGESLPYKSNLFDLVILNNVLDHTLDPTKVLSEIQRALKDGGILYSVTNTTLFVTRVYKKFVDVTKRVADLGYWEPLHPHTFTPSEIDDLLKRYGFEILERRKKGISFFGKRRRSLKERIALKLGIQIDQEPYTCLCKKGDRLRPW